MKPLEDLINTEEPGINLINEWISEAYNKAELLPASNQNEKVLLSLQVTTRSPMGAIAYETGGILIDGGWLRFRGSGHECLSRPLDGNDYEKGYIIIADDAVGGFFAINGGSLGNDPGMVYYLPPDNLNWEPLEIGFSAFFEWSLSENLSDFYQDLRWPTWQEDLKNLDPEKCYSFYPFLWTDQGSIEKSQRKEISVIECWNLINEFRAGL